MSWLVLFLAGLFEIGWPIGIKLSQSEGKLILGWAIAVACMTISGCLLWLAQRDIPLGTSYAVWTGIGSVGTFVVGVLYFGDAATLPRYAGIALIIAGVAALKLSH